MKLVLTIILNIYIFAQPFSYTSYNVDKLLIDAKKHYKNKDYNKTVEKLLVCQNSLPCTRFLAKIYKEESNIKDINKSIYFHKVSIELGDKSLWHNLGNLYFSVDRIDEAKNSFVKSGENKFYQSYFNLAKIYQKEDDISHTLKYYNLASKYNISEADYILGVYYFKQNDLNKSLFYFNKSSKQGFKLAISTLNKLKQYIKDKK